MPKILLIEDDKDLTEIIAEWLKAADFTYEIAYDGKSGWEFLRQGIYDVVIIDWDLPGMDGATICRQHRAHNGAVPIIMLTGRSQVEDKEKGLESGADDYLTKPFSMKELIARVRALLRRPSSNFGASLVVGKLEMDPLKHFLSVNGVEVRLQPKDFAVLELFMRHPGQTFSTESILRRVWNADAEVGSDAVRTAIKLLRKAIDSGDDASMIENVPRVGYRLRPQ